MSPEQKANILKSLSEAQEGLDFLVNLSSSDKKRLPKMGARSVGYVDDCIMAFEEFRNLLPNNLDTEELKRDRALYDALSGIAVRVRALNEALDDSMAALGSDMMNACNDGYAALRRSSKRDGTVKIAVERISQRYRANGQRAAKLGETA